MTFKTLLLALTLGVLAAGCSTSRTEYRPPTDPQGRMCVTDCAAMKQSCETSQQVLRQQCEYDYQRRQADFQRCEMQYRNTSPEICTQWRLKSVTVNGRTETTQECVSKVSKSNSCVRPTNTCTSLNNCERNYSQCFVGCGGQIVDVPLN